MLRWVGWWLRFVWVSVGFSGFVFGKSKRLTARNPLLPEKEEIKVIKDLII